MTHATKARRTVVQVSIVALLASGLLAASASAQAPNGTSPVPDIPPPPRLSDKPLPADDEDATSVTIRQEGENKIEEFRARGGKVYAVRVTPRIGKPYMLFDPDRRQDAITSGGFPPNEIDEGVRPAQWTLFEF